MQRCSSGCVLPRPTETPSASKARAQQIVASKVGRAPDVADLSAAIYPAVMGPGRIEALRAMGGLYEAEAPLVRPRSAEQMADLLAQAKRRGSKLTLVGARRSFGEQFLPVPGGQAVQTTELGGQVQWLETEADGSAWVRAPACLSFEELWRCTPGYLPMHPPTGDRATLGGALAACTHDAVGFFADDVRAFSLLTVDGTVHECRHDAGGERGELFRLVPGSFGALGVVLEIELLLRRLAPRQLVEVNVVDKRTTPDFGGLDRLELAFRNGEYSLGRGLFFVGCHRATVLFGDRFFLPTPSDRARPLLLADDAPFRNAVAQGLANRFPALLHHLHAAYFRQGARYRASPYGFAYHQRSYDRAFEVLSGTGAVPRLLRAARVDPRLTVCHQTFVVGPADARPFLEL